MEIYLVGGAVRDELLGRDPLDRDYVVLKCSEQVFEAAFPSARKIGKTEPHYLYQGGQYTLSPSEDIESDLKRRDLTINAFAKDAKGIVHGLAGSWKDLEDRILRPVSTDNFMQDPARVYRAARFAACLPRFSPHASLRVAMESTASAGLLPGIAAERVGQEFVKACSCPNPGRFLRLLWETGACMPWFAEVQACLGNVDGPEGATTVNRLDALAEALDSMAGLPVAVWLVLNLATVDIGAKQNREDDQCKKMVYKSTSVAERLALRLRLPNRFVRVARTAATWGQAAINYDTLSCSCKVDLLEHLMKQDIVRPFFQGVAKMAGRPFNDIVMEHLALIQNVTLPGSMRNKGKMSGVYLKKLRCAALVSATEKN